MSSRRSRRLAAACLAASLLTAGFSSAGARAQTPTVAESPGAALTRSLNTLAGNPRSVPALMGAGRAALAVGDAQAALTFFARAEEIAPTDGRIKMWIGSSLVHLVQPAPATRFFEAAAAAGVPEAEIARDRGLLHDISGNTRLAQRDYQLALGRGRDAELVRRLALSHAIGGEKERALLLLEEQLLTRDRAAERTRALILALTGDAAGAARAARVTMGDAQAAAIAPFLARLPSLAPADRAMAVHLGRFPGQSAQPGASFAMRSPTSAGAPDRSQPALGAAARPVSAPDEPRRRPGAVESAPVLASVARRAPPPRAVAPSAAPTAQAAPRQETPRPPARSRLADVAAALEGVEDRPVARPAPPPARPAASPARSPVVREPEPSRVWVQVAGGAVRSALPDTYSRLKTKAPTALGKRAAWTTPANATNRVLVGPFASTREAQGLVNALADAEVSAFVWTSPAGQRIERLAAR